MTMPNMTGVQLSQKLLEIRPDIKGGRSTNRSIE
jgi:hypothetical protein